MSMDGPHCDCDADPRLRLPGDPCPIHGEKGKAAWDRLQAALEAEKARREEAEEALVRERGTHPTEAQLAYFVKALENARSAHQLEVAGWKERWRQWGDAQCERAHAAEARAEEAEAWLNLAWDAIPAGIESPSDLVDAIEKLARGYERAEEATDARAVVFEAVQVQAEEMRLRLADAYDQMLKATSRAEVEFEDGDQLDWFLSFLNALDLSLKGEPGCIEPEEFQTARRNALREHGPRLQWGASTIVEVEE